MSRSSLCHLVLAVVMVGGGCSQKTEEAAVLSEDQEIGPAPHDFGATDPRFKDHRRAETQDRGEFEENRESVSVATLSNNSDQSQTHSSAANDPRTAQPRTNESQASNRSRSAKAGATSASLPAQCSSGTCGACAACMGSGAGSGKGTKGGSGGSEKGDGSDGRAGKQQPKAAPSSSPGSQQSSSGQCSSGTCGVCGACKGGGAGGGSQGSSGSGGAAGDQAKPTAPGTNSDGKKGESGTSSQDAKPAWGAGGGRSTSGNAQFEDVTAAPTLANKRIGSDVLGGAPGDMDPREPVVEGEKVQGDDLAREDRPRGRESNVEADDPASGDRSGKVGPEGRGVNENATDDSKYPNRKANANEVLGIAGAAADFRRDESFLDDPLPIPSSEDDRGESPPTSGSKPTPTDPSSVGDEESEDHLRQGGLSGFLIGGVWIEDDSAGIEDVEVPSLDFEEIGHQDTGISRAAPDHIIDTPFRGAWEQIEATAANAADFAPGGYEWRALGINPEDGRLMIYQGHGEGVVLAGEFGMAISDSEVTLSGGGDTITRFPANGTAIRSAGGNYDSPTTAIPATIGLEFNARVLNLGGKRYRRIDRARLNALRFALDAGSPTLGTSAEGAASLDLGTSLPPLDLRPPVNKVDFFGVPIVGQYVCLIVDRSGSMGNAGKMDKVKEQIEKTIEDLPGRVFFEVVFYSDPANTGTIDGNGWSRATPKNKRAFLKLLEAVGTSGGTMPADAITFAFTKLRPQPDVIMFLTDGLIPPGTSALFRSLNGASKGDETVVHTFAFGTDADHATLQLIADENNGLFNAVAN